MEERIKINDDITDGSQPTKEDIARLAGQGYKSVFNLRAFGGPDEADLVDRLRLSCAEAISLVSEWDGRLVGHILFSPVALDGHPQLYLMGLAPMAVLPARHRLASRRPTRLRVRWGSGHPPGPARRRPKAAPAPG